MGCVLDWEIGTLNFRGDCDLWGGVYDIIYKDWLGNEILLGCKCVCVCGGGDRLAVSSGLGGWGFPFCTF